MIDFLLKATELKDEKRSGFQLYNVERPESVAGHSWNTALLTLLYGEKHGINTERAVKIAIIHDLAEADTGDFSNRIDKEKRGYSEEEKENLEQEFWNRYSESIEREEIEELWKEYEERKTKEARFVKDMDLIDMVLEALKYEEQGRYPEEENEDKDYGGLDEFFESARSRLTTDTGKELFRVIEERYRETRE